MKLYVADGINLIKRISWTDHGKKPIATCFLVIL